MSELVDAGAGCLNEGEPTVQHDPVLTSQAVPADGAELLELDLDTNVRAVAHEHIEAVPSQRKVMAYLASNLRRQATRFAANLT